MAATESPTAVQPQPSVVATSGVRLRRTGCWIALIAFATLRAWFTRYELSPDSMSYLDIARAVAEGHAKAALSSYWSPGYPVLISFFLRIFHPGIYWEFPLVHAANVLIFAGTLACFELFWSDAFEWHSDHAGRDGTIPEGAFWALGYAAFAIAALNIITVGIPGPDLLVAAFALLAGWCVLRFRRAPGVASGVHGALLLALVLAFGYYAKAPFFPMAFVFIACAFCQRPFSRKNAVLAGAATAAFLLLAAPFITALSRMNGRITFGDTARMSEAFYIDGVQFFRHWQGGPPGSGTPIHPTRKLNDFPEVFEFAADNMGTYPPWFAPTYWYAGIRPHLILKRQAIVAARSLALEAQIIVESGAELICAAIFLALLAGYRRRWIITFRQLWFVWTPGAVALAMFALIHVEPRFLGGWLVMIFGGAACACSLSPEAGLRRAVWCISVAALVTSAGSVVLQASREAIGIDHADGRSAEEALIAAGLLESGLHAGDDVALIGDGTGAYWAHLARLQIVAEIPGGNASHLPAMDFWESGPASQQKTLNILQGTGAKAVIADEVAAMADGLPAGASSQWKRIGGTGAYIYLFPARR
jgi:hypothetical protein